MMDSQWLKMPQIFAASKFKDYYYCIAKDGCAMKEYGLKKVYLKIYFNWNLCCLNFELKVNTQFRQRKNSC